MTEIATDRQRWQERYDAALRSHPERKARFSTLSDIAVEPLYTADDLPGFDPERDLGLPGTFPYTRGIHSSMYRARLWTMRQFAGFGSAEDTNARFHYLLEHGVTGLSTAFDMPTLMGRDCDDPLSRGEVGREGVAVSSLADMRILFDRIPLGEVTTSMTINGPASIVWAMYLATAEERGVPFDTLGGTIQNDCLKEYIAQREWIVPVKPAMELVVDSFRYGAREVPKWNTVSISGYHIREAGSTAVQELAFTLLDGLEYVKWGSTRVWTGMISRRTCPSSSTSTTTSSRRSRSYGRRGGSGRARWSGGTTRPTRKRCSCGRMRRPRASR